MLVLGGGGASYERGTPVSDHAGLVINQLSTPAPTRHANLASMSRGSVVGTLHLPWLRDPEGLNTLLRDAAGARR